MEKLYQVSSVLSQVPVGSAEDTKAPSFPYFKGEGSPGRTGDGGGGGERTSLQGPRRPHSQTGTGSRGTEEGRDPSFGVGKGRGVDDISVL